MRILHFPQRDSGPASQGRAQVSHPSFEDGPVTSCLPVTRARDLAANFPDSDFQFRGHNNLKPNSAATAPAVSPVDRVHRSSWGSIRAICCSS